jgi:hypothetical protein
MKTLHALAAVAVLATVTAWAAMGADAPGSRPPGVGAQDWAPISDTLGVVFDQARPPAGDAVNSVPGETGVPAPRANRPISGSGLGGALLIPPISGYLMVKRGNLWQRVILVEPVKGPGPAG